MGHAPVLHPTTLCQMKPASRPKRKTRIILTARGRRDCFCFSEILSFIILKMGVHRTLKFYSERHYVVSSSQDYSRHIRRTAYCCYLPVLTRFAEPDCVRLDSQHHLHTTQTDIKSRRLEFSPAIADCRLQDTAGFPPSTPYIIFISFYLL